VTEPARTGAIARYSDDQRVVLTLDAGGTTLVFSAVRGERQVVRPVVLPSQAAGLEELLERITHGFREVRELLDAEPVAISFAFPGPADYRHGVIGDLENLPVFRGGVALGPMLEDEFGIPTLISNDGDLFACGEAIAGLLPQVNSLLERAGSPRRCRNLLAVTLGTGFGAGVVHDGHILTGDNSAGAEINRLRSVLDPRWSVEENVSVRALRRVYAREARVDAGEAPSPKEIFEIGMGERKGVREAARLAFEELAVAAGDALADASSLVDGLVVIGGGLAHGWPLFLARLVEEMNAPFAMPGGRALQRFESRAYSLEDPGQLEAFLKGEVREVVVPFSSRTVTYDASKAVGVGVTRLGTANAVSVGAYTLALQRLDGLD
jgi:glucokinase